MAGLHGVRPDKVMLLKAVITAFPCVSLPFLAVPLLSQPTVAISFSKFLVQGPPGAALAALQQLCANDVDTAQDALTYTGMLNQNGGRY
eukprot:SAG22_NODE_603_length_8633_cov_6.871455_2_plen_89_part_00